MSRIIEKILDNNKRFDRTKAGRVLILFEFEDFYIGDTCRRFAYFRSCKAFFENALVDLCCIKYYAICNDLLKNNPFINEVISKEWKDIDFLKYDTVISLSEYETTLAGLLNEKYDGIYVDDNFNLKVFSYSSILVKHNLEIVFPFFEELKAYVLDFQTKSAVKGVEIFIDRDEVEWAQQWLTAQGVEKDDKIIIMIDSSSGKGKLLNTEVYFQVLEHFLGKKQVKIVVFDEQKVGKKNFYEDWLGDKIKANLIFAEGLSLRQASCIIASENVAMILGPCTGLLHCASGVYKSYLETSTREAEKIPLMIVYAGLDVNERLSPNKWEWWGDSMVDCLLLKKNEAGNKEIVVLDSSNQEGYLPTAEYTADLLIEYIETHYQEKLPYYERLVI